MVEVVLGEPDELRERRIRRIRDERIVEVRGRKRRDRLAQPLVEREERCDVTLPGVLRRLGRRRPILLRRQLPAVAVEASQHELNARGHVQDQLPDAVRAGDRMRGRVRDGHALERLAHGRAVPRIALGAAAQLVDESFDGRGHVASLVAGGQRLLVAVGAQEREAEATRVVELPHVQVDGDDIWRLFPSRAWTC